MLWLESLLLVQGLESLPLVRGPAEGAEVGATLTVLLQSPHTRQVEQVAAGEEGQGAGLEGGQAHWTVGVELLQCPSSELLPGGGALGEVGMELQQSVCVCVRDVIIPSVLQINPPQ